MESYNKMIEQEDGISILGDITPQKRVTMLAYTINISPNDYLCGQQWGNMLPDEQVRFLKKVHHKTFYELWKIIDDSEDDNGNEVCFEFTKAGEVHSHGYFRILDRYGGYKKYIHTLSKSLKSMLPKSYYNVVVKWADNDEKWKEYMHKEDGTNGYKPYQTEYCERISRDITFWIDKVNN